MLRKLDMSISIIHHDAPRVHVPAFSVDGKLHGKLDDYELAALMNRSHNCAMIGRAGSGKTSIALSMLQSKDLFKQVFSKIFVIMPPTSRASLKNDPFKGLPANQVMDELTVSNLESIWQQIQAESKEKGNSLLILDDVQAAMKLTPIERMLVHMNNNRRHQRLSIWVCCQNYVKLPRSFRMGLTNMFLFSVSKADMAQIHEELLEIPENTWERACVMFKHYKERPSKEKSFLFVDVRDQRYFLDWDELRMPKEDCGMEMSNGFDSDKD